MKLSCIDSCTSGLKQSLIANAAYIKKLTGQPPVSFSCPLGQASLASKSVAAMYFMTARGIKSGINTGPESI